MALASSTQVAQALNVSVRRVEQLVHEGMPRAERGKYDLGKCLLFYVRYLQAVIEKRGPNAESSPDAKVARTRLTEVEVAIREIDLAERRREIVSTRDAAALWEDAVARMRSRLISSGRKSAPDLVGLKTNAQAEEAIIAVVYEALAELVNLADDYDEDTEAEEAQAEKPEKPRRKAPAKKAPAKKKAAAHG